MRTKIIDFLNRFFHYFFIAIPLVFFIILGIWILKAILDGSWQLFDFLFN
jgi:hypothetical protein